MIVLTFKQLVKGYESGKVTLEELYEYKNIISSKATEMIQDPKSADYDELKSLLEICLDYYTYGEEGSLIFDTDYDILMNIYMSKGGNQIVYSKAKEKDLGSTWPMKKHEAPYMVGSVRKIYDEDSLKDYIKSMLLKTNLFYIAPKFDGVSACLKIDLSKKGVDMMEYALTRKDGFVGQDITPLIKRASNIDKVLQTVKMMSNDGKIAYTKCEICMSTSSFEEMNENVDDYSQAKYKNRRSAVSGIINTPKNKDLGKYLTVIPLITQIDNDKPILHGNSADLLMINPNMAIMSSHFQGLFGYSLVRGDKKEIKKATLNLLNDLKETPEYPFRFDGVILFPKISKDFSDIMENAMAFKINSKIGYGTAIEIYPSIGRTGKVTPMLRVTPTEVNETTVTEVSLSSINKMQAFDIREGEVVTIYSAGDVIPMVEEKSPLEKDKWKSHPKLKFAYTCPFCNSKLEYVKNELYCINPQCPRVIVGTIVKFITGMGIQNISDKTVHNLLELGLLDDGILSLYNAESWRPILQDTDGYDITSINNMINSLNSLSELPVTVSTFLAALPIENFNLKKAKTLLDKIRLDDIVRYIKEDRKFKLIQEIESIKGFGEANAYAIANYFEMNLPTITKLINNTNLIEDKQYIGNVVFTGFRDAELAELFDKNLDIDYSDNINSKTVYLVCANKNSTKANKAKEKGIPILSIEEAYIVANKI